MSVKRFLISVVYVHIWLMYIKKTIKTIIFLS